MIGDHNAGAGRQVFQTANFDTDASEWKRRARAGGHPATPAIEARYEDRAHNGSQRANNECQPRVNAVENTADLAARIA